MLHTKIPLLLITLLLSGCKFSTDDLSSATLMTLPIGWLMYAGIRQSLSNIYQPWRAPNWRGWWVGLVLFIALAAWSTTIRPLKDPVVEYIFVLYALVTSASSMVGFSLIIWRILRRLGDWVNWAAPLLVSAAFAWVTYPALTQRTELFGQAVLFWQSGGAGIIIPTVLLIIEAWVRRWRANHDS